MDKKLFLWEHPSIGNNKVHFVILKILISESFRFWDALEKNIIAVTADVINEDDEMTSYLVSISGPGEDAAKWCGEISIDDNREAFIGTNDGDLIETNPLHLVNVILIQLLHGHE